MPEYNIGGWNIKRSSGHWTAVHDNYDGPGCPLATFGRDLEECLAAMQTAEDEWKDVAGHYPWEA